MAEITSAGTGDWNVGGTWTGGSVPHVTNDKASIQSGHNVTLVANTSIGHMNIAGGTLTGGGYKLTVNTGGDKCFNHDGTISGVLDVDVINLGSDSDLDLVGTGNIRHLVINSSGDQIGFQGPATHTIDGDLTITAGELTTVNQSDGSNQSNLTVTGDVLIATAGTLTCNSSALQCRGIDVAGSGTLTAPDGSGSFTITGAQGGSSEGDAFDTEAASTFTHSSGTIRLQETHNHK